MQIQWYPGHMHKARKQLAATLPHVDVVIEVLDARIPFSSENPMLAELRGDKPCIKVLTKSDLADPAVTRQWQTFLQQQRHINALALSSKEPAKIRRLPALCRQLAAPKKNRITDIQAIILGIPNVGKSTLINTLAGKSIADTGNEPAITKAQQQIRLPGGITLLDTPGLLWPNLENKHSGYRLAALGAIRDTALDHTDVALFAAACLLDLYPDKLRSRYAINQLPDSELAVLESIGRKRGCLRAGGQVDLDKVSKLLLTELRSGALGAVSLETPEMMHNELAELALIRERKAARKRR